MDIFIKVKGNSIVDIFTDDIEDKLKCVKSEDMESFYTQTTEYKLPEEIEDKVKDLLEKTENNESLNLFDIKHWVINRSFGELIDMYENEEILKPEMQREFVWDSLKCSRLIESIILGLPIPPLFLLESGKNEYELIDGFQRLTTITNFVNGNPWSGRQEGKRNVTAKLSSKISRELAGKTFEMLMDEHKKTIKRSTIPLIQFNIVEQNNLSAKYLIFERINTGSEKLNQMQIRKSLAHGALIKSLYNIAGKNEKFTNLFSNNSLKKDNHVEAYLRIIAITEIYYEKYIPQNFGINNILNSYCDLNRNKLIEEDKAKKISKAISKLYSIFEHDYVLFRRVEKENGDFVITGNLNVSILEAFIGILVNEGEKVTISDEEIRSNYLKIMHTTLKESRENGVKNPFTTSTGSKDSIIRRYNIIKSIVGL